MRVFALVCCLSSMATRVAADESGLERSLKMLAPPERLEQLCDYTAVMRIRDKNNDLHPDRAVASAAAEPYLRDHTIIANGAAFRSRGKWYALSFSCTADAEHLKVLNFKFTIGDKIPEANWAAYGLWD